MQSVYHLKPRFQRMLHPLCRFFKDRGISPNQISVAAIVLSFVMAALLCLYPHVSWPLFIMPAVLFVRMALNAIDGMMARKYGMTSKLGIMLNEIGDVVSDSAVYGSLAMNPIIPVAPIAFIVVLSMVSEMTGVVAFQVGGTRRYDGPMGKSDRAFVFGLLSLSMGIGLLEKIWLPPLLWAINGLLVLTIINRCRKSLKEARQ